MLPSRDLIAEALLDQLLNDISAAGYDEVLAVKFKIKDEEFETFSEIIEEMKCRLLAYLDTLGSGAIAK
jgi:hypothetical protein